MEEVVIPSINQYGKKFRSDWKDVTLTEFLKWIGIWIAQKLLIASMVKPGILGAFNIVKSIPAMDFGRFMPRNRFEQILTQWLCS